MSVGKNLAIGVLVYIILNFVFVLVFVAVGGFQVPNPDVPGEMIAVDLSAFFSEYLGNDIVGFICVLLSPGGMDMSPLAAMNFFLDDIKAEEPVKVFSTTADIIGLLWALIPGLMSALGVAIISKEQPKEGFIGLLAGILIITIVPMVLGVAGLVDPVAEEGLLSATFLPVDYWPTILDSSLVAVVSWQATDYVTIVISAIVNGVFWGSLCGIIAYIRENSY